MRPAADVLRSSPYRLTWPAVKARDDVVGRELAMHVEELNAIVCVQVTPAVLAAVDAYLAHEGTCLAYDYRDAHVCTAGAELLESVGEAGETAGGRLYVLTD